MTGTLHEDLCAFMVSRGILLVLRNISDKSLEKIKTHFMSCNVDVITSMVSISRGS